MGKPSLLPSPEEGEEKSLVSAVQQMRLIAVEFHQLHILFDILLYAHSANY